MLIDGGHRHLKQLRDQGLAQPQRLVDEPTFDPRVAVFRPIEKELAGRPAGRLPKRQRLAGVSGHGARSFYYPESAETNCNGCHMPQIASDDFGADDVDGELKIRSHLFPSANTAIPKLVNMENADEVIQQHQEFLRDNVRIDIFGIREGVGINGELHAPLGSGVELEPGKTPPPARAAAAWSAEMPGAETTSTRRAASVTPRSSGTRSISSTTVTSAPTMSEYSWL